MRIELPFIGSVRVYINKNAGLHNVKVINIYSNGAYKLKK